jgi:hypothetical protein
VRTKWGVGAPNQRIENHPNALGVAVREEGEESLLDRRLRKLSPKRVTTFEAQEIERLYRERYQGFMANTSTSMR